MDIINYLTLCAGCKSLVEVQTTLAWFVFEDEGITPELVWDMLQVKLVVDSPADIEAADAEVRQYEQDELDYLSDYRPTRPAVVEGGEWWWVSSRGEWEWFSYEELYPEQDDYDLARCLTDVKHPRFVM